jgi:hypothetical protein
LNWDSFKWRNHQPDIGRFFNIDPLADKYVYNSPYAFAENRVIDGRELEGLEWVPSRGPDGEIDPKMAQESIDAYRSITQSVGSFFSEIGEAIGEAWGNRPNVITVGDGPSSNTDHLPKPRDGETIVIDMDDLDALELATGQQKLKPSRASKNRSGRTDGTTVRDVAESQTGNGDKDALEPFKNGIQIGDTIESYGNLPKGDTVVNTKTLKSDTSKRVTNTWQFVDDYKIKLLNSDTTQKQR